MAPLSVDASNACIPPSHPLVSSTPPLPTSVDRGHPIRCFDGYGGRFNDEKKLIVYGSGKLVVVRELIDEEDLSAGGEDVEKEGKRRVRAFVYRGHNAQVTAARFSPSGCYVASADVKGRLRVWSYDHEEHLCKLELNNAMAGPIRDLDWDGEGKRIVLVGEGSKTDAASESARVIQWDTGVKCGDLGKHARNRASTCAFKPNRPMRIVTGGHDDFRCYFHNGPPFARMVSTGADGLDAEERAHTRGAVHAVRYDHAGTKIASVGTDGSVCIYDGKTMALLKKMENVHGTSSIYGCEWNSDGKFLLTCAADGNVKLIDAEEGTVVYSWDVAGAQQQQKKKRSDDDDGTTSSSPGMGGLQLGCTFVNGDVPASVGYNGIVSVLPVPPDLPLASAGKGGGDDSVSPHTLTGHQAPISALAVDHDSHRMYTGDTDGVIVEWDMSGRALRRIHRVGGKGDNDESLLNKVHIGAITCMACISRGSAMTLSAGWDDALRITSGGCAVSVIKLQAQPNAMARGTDLVAIKTVKGMILMKNNEIVLDLHALSYAALCVCVSADDSIIFVGGDDCSIHVYSVSATHELKEIKTIQNGHLKPISALALSHDGTKLASADVRDVCVWSVPSSVESGEFQVLVGKSRWCFHTQRISQLAWSSDDKLLASGGNDDNIYLWNLDKKMKRVHYPFAHRGGVTGLEFLSQTESPNEIILVSTGSDGCVNQWDVSKDVKSKFG